MDLETLEGKRERMRKALEFEKRLAAAKNGDNTYQGNPCKHGHDGERYTMTGQCVVCTRTRALTRMREQAQLLKAAKAEARAAKGE